VLAVFTSAERPSSRGSCASCVYFCIEAVVDHDHMLDVFTSL